MDSSEENDKVGYMDDDTNAFRQVDYLWLFNKHLKFSEREQYFLEDANVTSEDFLRMREINRRVLTNFLKERQREAALLDGENPEYLGSFDMEDDED